LARPAEAALADEVHLVEADGTGVRQLDVGRRPVRFPTGLGGRLPYPSYVLAGDVLRLERPRVMDPTPFGLRLTYDALCRGRPGTAFCQAAAPDRFRWSVLGRAIRLATGK